MEPNYFIENRYSFVVDALPVINNVNYEVDTPETQFEQDVQRQLATANHLLMEGRYGNALIKYRHLRGMIAAVINPQISVDSGMYIDWPSFEHPELVVTTIAKSVEMLINTPIVECTIPPRFRGGEVPLPDEVAKQFAIFEMIGLADQEAYVGVKLDEAETAMEGQKFEKAIDHLKEVLRMTKDPDIQGSIWHDIAIIEERLGHRDQALKTMQRSVSTFERLKHADYQVTALNDMAGMQARWGNIDEANKTLKKAEKLQKAHNLFPIVTGMEQPPLAGSSLIQPLDRLTPKDWPSAFFISEPPYMAGPRYPMMRAGYHAPAAHEVTDEFLAKPAQMMSFEVYAARDTQKQMTILDSQNNPQYIQLNDQATENLTAFYEEMRTTNDLGLLMGYLSGYTITIAYLTHVYFWVIPMAMGDCYASLGSYEDAEAEYLTTLDYEYLNEVVESVNLWLRLAELYNDWGDRLYRQARNDVSEFSKARVKYEKIMRLNNTVSNSSPLYQSSKFASLKNRVQNVILNFFVNNTAVAENPRIVIALMRARIQLTKIDNELNFIGLGVHVPPFSFEYMQNLARYFTQHASQVEQMYIQFQSTGENEKLREQQMAQQVDIAAASVELEERGLDEAEEGVDVAQANYNYANTQHANAVDASNDFANARWELLELDSLQAWSSAAAMDEDDEVQQRISGFTYYNTGYKDRSDVLFDLACQRTRLTHDLEANRLQREINAAIAYRNTADQQIQQARARVDIAEQRVVLAEMQHQHAQENLAFLNGREFTSAMWYNLARESRRVAQRYLDMAIEVATLMEKAYEAETGRDLRKIKFEYGLNHLNGLLGAEALLMDIDFFSLDFVRTKAKKAPMKQTISLADHFPMAFNRLLQTGQTFFETTLDHFDRLFPGFYLQKVKQVEMMFVGLNGTEGVHGTLRNIGLSQFRKKDGTIVNQIYPADVMPLSEYSVRQDMLVFQLDNKELRLFENNGVATMWQIDLPLRTNTFDLNQILDIQLVVYYDGFFNAGLEQQILAALPAGSSASRGLSLRMIAPDEMFYLRSQGTAELQIIPELFPANHLKPMLTHYAIQARGENVAGLQLRVNFDALGQSHTFKLDATGYVDGAADFAAPIKLSLFDTWTVTIDPALNPGFDPSTLVDLSIFIEYDFDYPN